MIHKSVNAVTDLSHTNLALPLVGKKCRMDNVRQNFGIDVRFSS
ncbi:MAG: hypothetical protein IEMM0002_1416 [bacterium]|nr:MAG: hypothetical protein IEMM0002_1416 [bacterium]